jgi:ZIP family zinc transporter
LILLSIDIFLDGLLDGISFVTGKHAGITLTVAFGLECFIMGIVLTLRLKKNTPGLLHACVCCVVALLFPAGNVVGDTLLSHLTGAWKAGVVSFGIGALLYLVTDELLLEGREKRSAVKWYTRIQFFVGFLAIFIFHLADSEGT